MPINPKYLVDFHPEKSYHVFNRTNNKELLYKSDENCRFFLESYDDYLAYLMETYAWGLMPNHFHLEVKTRPEEYSKDWLSRIPKKKRTLTENKFLIGKMPYEILVSRAFKRFFQSYSMSVNNHLRRNGSLFSRRFRRTDIADDEHFKKVMLYIHTNPVKHGITRDFREYDWISYHDYIENALPQNIITEVYEKFGNKQAFIAAHEVQQSNILYRDYDFL